MKINLKNEAHRYHAFLVAIFLLSLAIRLYWAFAVQPPSETVFSDMRSYMFRAVHLLLDEQEIDEARKLETALFPYGVHYLYAAQLWLFGEVTDKLPEIARYHFVGQKLHGMAFAQALLGALTVLFAVMAARRSFRTLAGPFVVGIVLALWHPLITYVGFFSSENPFSFLLTLGIWLWIRYVQTGRGAIWAGIVTALGITVRPQLLLTALLFIAWTIIRKAVIPNFRWKQLAWFALPIVVVLVFSAVRFHHFTGRVGLVSDNGAIARFFACTDYYEIKTKKGKRFHPPARSKRAGFEGVFRFDSHIADANHLDPERRRIWSIKSTVQKLATLRRNIVMLFNNNVLWPESNAVSYTGRYARWVKKKELAKTPLSRAERKHLVKSAEDQARAAAKRARGWRHPFAEKWKPFIAYGLFPLACLALIFLWFFSVPALELATLHLLTMLVTAALFFGELRYRVPYDPILVILAVTPVMFFLERKQGWPRQQTIIRYSAAAAVAAIGFILLPWG